MAAFFDGLHWYQIMGLSALVSVILLMLIVAQFYFVAPRGVWISFRPPTGRVRNMIPFIRDVWKFSPVIAIEITLVPVILLGSNLYWIFLKLFEA